MVVEISKDALSWDQYVESCDEAANYHRWCWRKAIEDTFGHKPYYLAALNNGTIEGVLPLFFIKSWLFGRSLVSVPFFSYGGVLASMPAAREALLSKAAEIASGLGAKHIELRQNISCGIPWPETSAKVGMEIPLPPTSDELWKRLSSGMRNKIRNGRKSAFGVQWGGIEDIRYFYPVFATNMRNLGTPVYPREWFENLWRCRPEDIRVLTLWDGKRAVAAAFLNEFRGTLELPWSASVPESRKKYSQVFLYWTFLEWAIEHGYRRMDLGRCTAGGGTYEFKRHWVCEERRLHWHHWRAHGNSSPELKQDSSRFGLAVQAWKRLPLFVANGLGPHIVRSIP